MIDLAQIPAHPHVEGSRLQPGDEDLQQVPYAVPARRAPGHRREGRRRQLRPALRRRRPPVVAVARPLPDRRRPRTSLRPVQALGDGPPGGAVARAGRALRPSTANGSTPSTRSSTTACLTTSSSTTSSTWTAAAWLSTAARRQLLAGLPIASVAVIHDGPRPRTLADLRALVTHPATSPPPGATPSPPRPPPPTSTPAAPSARPTPKTPWRASTSSTSGRRPHRPLQVDPPQLPASRRRLRQPLADAPHRAQRAGAGRRHLRAGVVTFTRDEQ
jgi:hypothetical protein